MVKLRKGLDVPLAGVPDCSVIQEKFTEYVAVTGTDYPGMKPTILVSEGEDVGVGAALFEDKRTAGVVYRTPVAGTVTQIKRGHKRALLSVIIKVADQADQGMTFEPVAREKLQELEGQDVQQRMVESGLWTALRTRPYDKVPAPESLFSSPPSSIFVTATDSRPLAADPLVVIQDAILDFNAGIEILACLANVPVHVCIGPNWNKSKVMNTKVNYHVFEGPHPSGLVGTHVHRIDAVSAHKQIWHIGYQDVIALGQLFLVGTIATQKVVAVTGPQVEKPSLVRTWRGADIAALVDGQLKSGENRLISGDVLSGRRALGSLRFLGAYDQQVTVLQEGREQEFLGWLTPGVGKHSALRIYLSSLFRGKKLNLTTAVNGSARAMIPVPSFDSVMPLDILAPVLLRALIVGDTDAAQELGCLELAEEDLALCTYVCPGKYEYGPILRNNLTTIEREG